jgi:hypothetical protein
MRAHRASVAVAISVVLAICGVGAAVAQDAGLGEQLCISVAGTAPEGGWDILSLSVAIASGNATISTVGAAGDCGAAAPVAEGPTQEPAVNEPATEPVVEEPVTEEPATEPDVAADAPLPIEVVESAIYGRGEEAAYYALLRNPNPSRWTATWMPVRVDLLDGDGGLVSTYDRSVTLLPGQTGAISGYRGEAQGATQIDVVVANGETDWTDVPESPGDLSFSQLKTKVTDTGTKTTGRVSSTYETQVESVNVYVLYRDASGAVVGAGNTYIDFIPAAGDANFMLENWSEKKPDVASTEVYYDGFLPPTE